MNRMTFSVTFAVALGGCTLAHANWYGFGGAQTDFNVVSNGRFESNEPVVLWSRELGFGNSSIAVRDGILFTQYRALDASGNTSDNETVVALNADDGRMVWEHQYLERPIAGQNDYGGGTGPHATPFVTEDHVFTLGYAGTLHCLARETGEVIWKRNLVSDFGAEAIQFGFSASPFVVDQKLIVQVSSGDAGLVALAPATGKLIWKSAPTGGSYATPVLMSFGGEDQLVFVSQNFVQGIDPETGTVRWQYEMPKEGLTNVPIPLDVGDGRIFLAGQGIGGAAVIRVTVTKDDFNVEELWRNTKVNFFHNSFVHQGGFVFGGSSFLYGLNVETGEKAWTERGYELANVIGLGDGALLAPKDGRIAMVKLTGEGVTELGSLDLFGTEAWAPPSIADGIVYARDREAIAAISFSQRKAPVNAPSFLAAKNRMKALVEAADSDALTKLLKEWAGSVTPSVSRSSQLRVAQAMADADDLPGARLLLSTIIDVDPTSVEALSKLGRLLLVVGEREEAIVAYRRAVDIDPAFEEGKRILSQFGEGNSTPGNVNFELSRVRGAKLVTVAGSFNGWDPFHTFLRKNGSTWETTIDLPPGEYEYKFVVDGNWMLDPKNRNRRDDGNNNVNSLLIVE